MENKWKVIYYEDENNCSEVFDFIEKQKETNQIKILNWIEKLEELGPNLPRPYADYLEDGIYELRIKLSGDQIRILYFFCYKEFIILSNQFRKNTDKVPVKEIKKAKILKEIFTNDMMNLQLGGYTMKTFKSHLESKLKNDNFKDGYLEEKKLIELSLMIHNVRENNGLSQNQVAKKAHITQQQMSKIENGINCNIITFLKVCNALGIDFNFNNINKRGHLC